MIGLITVLFSLNAEAKNGRQIKIPNGTVNSCANCHINPGGGGARTPFGEEVFAAIGSVPRPASFDFWDAELAGGDADDDDISNGEELGDPDGDFLNLGPSSEVTRPWVFDNTAPQIGGSPSSAGFFGETYSANFSAFDLNDHGVTFSKVSGPDWLEVAANGAVSGAPPEGPLETVDVTIRATDNYSSPLFTDEMFSINLSASFAGWQNLNFTLPGESGLSGADKDSDNDDIPNIAEYALRLNPKQTDSVDVPGTPEFDGIGRMQFVLQVRDDDPSLSIQLEASNAVPFSSAASIDPVITDPNGSDGFETWTFTDTISNNSITSRFGQLKFQLPQ